ncbi:hypothetical protein HNP55_001435 [Paucibacter oligotrophus]|uniref:Uncharacterized protein n=1 Tax=Roseateles oligotrophus TaxID=1769250 RepID=A0A840L3Y7_9BURK|nr:hypothetical protein [Roseateles oligotrophus]MBB4842920.1 hypothetical protein [Roseateles oligotrophus]
MKIHTQLQAPGPAKSSNSGLARSDSSGGRKAVADGPTPAPAPGPAPGPAAPPATPSLSLSGDSYTDSGNVSNKLIKFNVTVPSSLTAADYCLVNKLQGHMKKADGTFHNVRMYGSVVPFNFASEQVDSVDADPIYWSDASQRRNYTAESGGFSATDDPGPPGHSFAKGDEAKVKFHIGLYRTADVPTTTTGTLAAAPISELPWQYSVLADATTGALSHPVL